MVKTLCSEAEYDCDGSGEIDSQEFEDLIRRAFAFFPREWLDIQWGSMEEMNGIYKIVENPW